MNTQIDAKLVNIYRVIINYISLNTIFISTEKNYLHCYQFSIRQLRDKERHKLQNLKAQRDVLSNNA